MRKPSQKKNTGWLHTAMHTHSNEFLFFGRGKLMTKQACFKKQCCSFIKDEDASILTAVHIEAAVPGGENLPAEQILQ
jgi:hypothetical protein